MSLAVDTSEIPQELWQSALAMLERTFSEGLYQGFVKLLRPVSLHGNELTLTAPNQLARQWMETRLRAQLTDILSETFGERLELFFVIDPTAETTPMNDAPSHATLSEMIPPLLPPIARVDDVRTANLNARY